MNTESSNQDYESFCGLGELSRRIGLSRRSIRAKIHDHVKPLPALKVGGKLLFNYREVVQWLEGFRVQAVDVDEIVDSMRRGRNG